MEKLYYSASSQKGSFAFRVFGPVGGKQDAVSKTHSSKFYVSNIFYSFSFFVKERRISVRSYSQVNLIREILSELEFDLVLRSQISDAICVTYAFVHLKVKLKYLTGKKKQTSAKKGCYSET